MEREIKNVSIIGMGALGLLFGAQIMKQSPETNLCYVMDQERYERNKQTEFFVNEQAVPFPMVSAGEAAPADLLIVAVKSTGLIAALDAIQNCVGEHTIILSIINGISSERIIAERYGREKILYTVAQGMDAVRFANKLTYTHMGELHIGGTCEADSEKLRTVAAFFEKAGLPHVIEEDILRHLWNKFMLNVGINQACMVFQGTYGDACEPGEINRIMISAMREAKAVAEAEGVLLTEEDIRMWMKVLRSLRPEGLPSMAQDRISRKPSEVELFAGEVLSLGKKHHIPVPVNEFLYQRVKEIESAY